MFSARIVSQFRHHCFKPITWNCPTDMNKITLAFCPQNAALAAAIEQPISRLGLPFDLVSAEPANPPGTFGRYLRGIQEPVLLLITDNFLHDKNCMSGALETVQTLSRQQRVLTVVADGIDAQGGRVETHIERMVNAIQYTNHWQSIYLDLSAQQSHVPTEERTQFDAELSVIRDISNEVFDLITALRESNCITWNQLVANDFELFFAHFGLREWHEQYRQLIHPAPAEEVIPAQTPPVSGPLAPAPAVSEPLQWPDEAPPAAEAEPALEHIDQLIAEAEEPAMDTTPVQEPEQPEQHSGSLTDDDIRQTIRDAWFWLENGHIERGLQVFQLALEEHPHNADLREHYENALSKFSPAEEEGMELQEIDTSHVGTPDISEARSFDQIGEEALEKGDYLFAKFCWDRVVELSPNYPGIYRKLGLMTSVHLRDYRETAIHYLDKALEQNPEDQEVREKLAALLNSVTPLVEPVPAAPEASQPEIQELKKPADQMETNVAAETPEQEEKVAAAPTPARNENQLTVLITGASSGIGRASARVFAQNGHRLILVARRKEKLDELAAELQNNWQTDVLTLQLDVRDSQAVRQVLGNLPDEWQDIDVLLNNAGLAKGLSPIHEGELDHWETMIDTNVKGVLYVTRCIAPGMVQRRKGHIINLSSSAGKEVYPKGNVYCATKFAVEALTRAMRLDLHAYNIRVSQVSPGHVEETEFAVTRFDGDREKAKIYEDFQPLKSSDVAEVIYFMASRPAHVNIQDIWLFGTQQASSTVIDRSGR